MKKILLILFLLLNLLSAYKVEITGDGVRVWKKWSDRIVTKPYCFLPPGGEYLVVGTYSPYYKVLVLSGARRGEIVYIWSETYNKVTKMVSGAGVVCRTKPIKEKQYENGVLYNGTMVKILEKIINRYKIRLNKIFCTCIPIDVWVWAETCEKIH